LQSNFQSNRLEGGSGGPRPTVGGGPGSSYSHHSDHQSSHQQQQQQQQPPPREPPSRHHDPAPSKADNNSALIYNFKLDFEVPREFVGALIGKGGSNISDMKQRSGASIQVSKDTTSTGSTPVQITCKSEHNLNEAKRLVLETLESVVSRFFSPLNNRLREGAEIITVRTNNNNSPAVTPVRVETSIAVAGGAPTTVRSTTKRTMAVTNNNNNAPLIPPHRHRPLLIKATINNNNKEEESTEVGRTHPVPITLEAPLIINNVVVVVITVTVHNRGSSTPLATPLILLLLLLLVVVVVVEVVVRINKAHFVLSLNNNKVVMLNLVLVPMEVLEVQECNGSLLPTLIAEILIGMILVLWKLRGQNLHICCNVLHFTLLKPLLMILL